MLRRCRMQSGPRWRPLDLHAALFGRRALRQRADGRRQLRAPDPALCAGPDIKSETRSRRPVDRCADDRISGAGRRIRRAELADARGVDYGARLTPGLSIVSCERAERSVCLGHAGFHAPVSRERQQSLRRLSRNLRIGACRAWRASRGSCRLHGKDQGPSWRRRGERSSARSRIGRPLRDLPCRTWRRESKAR